MNDKTIELINNLAAKFGTTTDHLWGVLLKQAVLSSITDLVISIVLILIWVWCFKFLKRKTEENQSSGAELPDEFGLVLGWIFLGIAMLIIGIFTCCAVSQSITAIFNPEFWALNQIFALKK